MLTSPHGEQEDFTAAAEAATGLSKKPSDADLLVLYGLFKQAKVGDCNTSKPGMLDLKGKAKWNAWNGLKGKAADEAKEEYIAKVEQLKEA